VGSRGVPNLISQTLASKRILLLVGGGIAAYKSLDLVRRLKERGASVHAVLTSAGAKFVTPLSLAALCGEPVREDLFSLSDDARMGHIELSRDADLIIIAPATADLLAKAANGLADDLASTLLLATDKRALAAPAMNLRMWLHPATARNVASLARDGMVFVGPNDGDMACGEYGPGRMAEPLEIVEAAERALAAPTAVPLPQGVGERPRAGPLAGKRVVITSGPTHEPIDPVRYIANRSSGKQGHAIARAAADAGAEVILISGPVSIADPAGVAIRHVETAREMLAAVEASLPADIFIAAAAVADWRVGTAQASKLKKGASGPPTLGLVENPDILATVSARANGRPRLVVGFAAETDDVIAHARAKLARKKCDLIIANDVSPENDVMGGDENTVHLVSAGGVDSWPKMRKEDVAARLVSVLAGLIGGAGS
jgi:phosphopantothenoylcysteine decarboxylase/phosphopantothenate--cysteine ligase